MEEKIQMWECFLNADGAPMQLSSEFIAVDGEKIEQAEGSGKDGIYIWDVPADKLAERKIRISIPDVGLEQTIAFSAPPSIGDRLRLSDVAY